MGSYANHLIPTTTGLNLGSQTQAWNIFANLINGAQPVNMSIQPIGYAANLAFSTQAIFTVFQVLLTGNVSATAFSGVAGLVLVLVSQDSAGGRSFTWPTSFLQPASIGTVANQTTAQLFYFDGTNGWPLTSGTVYP